MDAKVLLDVTDALLVKHWPAKSDSAPHGDRFNVACVRVCVWALHTEKWHCKDDISHTHALTEGFATSLVRHRSSRLVFGVTRKNFCALKCNISFYRFRSISPLHLGSRKCDLSLLLSYVTFDACCVCLLFHYGLPSAFTCIQQNGRHHFLCLSNSSSCWKVNGSDSLHRKQFWLGTGLSTNADRLLGSGPLWFPQGRWRRWTWQNCGFKAWGQIERGTQVCFEKSTTKCQKPPHTKCPHWRWLFWWNGI